MKIYTFGFSCLLLLQGCSTHSTWILQKNEAAKRAHFEIMQELDKKLQREPASALNDLNVNFSDLQKLSPGKFEVYVFPKISSQSNKESVGKDDYLGPPQLYEVSILAVNTCQQFIEKGLFAKYNPVEAFPKELAPEGRNCAILEIIDKRLTSIDRALLKADDQIAVRLFIDDNYRIHATDQTIYEARNKFRLVRRLAADEPITSGMSFFPMDLPTDVVSAGRAAMPDYVANKIDPIAVHQIRQRYSGSFEAQRCDGVVFTSTDPMGGFTQVGWCKGIPWPSYQENRRFFSVTQPLRVR